MNFSTVKEPEVAKGSVYCPICTRTVEAQIAMNAKKRVCVKPGQRCAHCGSSLDAAFVLEYDRAA
jgi:transposase-like protein